MAKKEEIKRDRIALVGAQTNRQSTTTTVDQLFINCFPVQVKNPITGQLTQVYISKRPGFEKIGTFRASSSPEYGGMVWTGRTLSTNKLIFSVATTGNVVAFYDNNGAQVGGDIATSNHCNFMNETKIGGTSNLTAMITDSGTGNIEYWFYPEGGAWTQIVDADFPANLANGPHVHMDGYMFVMTQSGRIYNSDLNSLSSWTSTSFIEAQSMPDAGAGLGRYKDCVVAFGRNSIEFFKNVGNALGSPLQRVPELMIKTGALESTFSVSIPPQIIQVGDTIYWVGVDEDSQTKGIYRLKDFKPEKISTPAIDLKLTTGDGFAGVGTLLGQTHVFMVGGKVYNIENDFWWTFSSADATVTLKKVLGNSFSASVGTGSDLETFKPGTSEGLNYFQDNTIDLTMTVQTRSLDQNSMKRKFCSAVTVIGERRPTGASCIVNVSYSDDDFANFSTARPIDLTGANVRLCALGAYRRRAWKLTNAVDTPCRMEAIEIEYSEGLN